MHCLHQKRVEDLKVVNESCSSDGYYNLGRICSDSAGPTAASSGRIEEM